MSIAIPTFATHVREQTRRLSSVAADVQHVLRTPGYHKRMEFCEAVRRELDDLVARRKLKLVEVELQETRGVYARVVAYQSTGR